MESHPDGTFSIEAVGLDRIQLERLDTTGTFPVGQVVDRPEHEAPGLRELLDRARSTFTAYRAALAEIRVDPYEGDLPQDPSYLSWTLAACAPLPLHERQGLLEAEDAAQRLQMVTDLLRAELRAMNVIPRCRPPRSRGRAGRPTETPLRSSRAQEGGRRVFTLREYEHDPRAASFGLEAAEALGVVPDRVFKTLMATLDGLLVVGIVPVTLLLDLKALARALGGSKAAMAEVADAERATGYVAGGISPVEDPAEREAAGTAGGRRPLVVEPPLSARNGRWNQIVWSRDAICTSVASTSCAASVAPSRDTSLA